MFSQVYANNFTISASSLPFAAGDPSTLRVPFKIPETYLDTITKIELSVNYHLNFDTVGWGSHAFSFDQDIYVFLQLPDLGYGTFYCQLDTSNSKVITFNTEKNTTISFNPNSVAGYDQQASHEAKIDLLDVFFINGGSGETITFKELVLRKGAFGFGGLAYNFQRTVGCPITSLSQCLTTYAIDLTVEATPPKL